MLENRQNMDDDRIGGLEVSLREAQTNATEADKKYEEVSPTAKFHLYLTFLAVCLPVNATVFCSVSVSYRHFNYHHFIASPVILYHIFLSQPAILPCHLYSWSISHCL